MFDVFNAEHHGIRIFASGSAADVAEISVCGYQVGIGVNLDTFMTFMKVTLRRDFIREPLLIRVVLGAFLEAGLR